MSRRAYDHRIKEEIVRAGDPDLFPELEIPRSTALSWIRRGLGQDVSLDQDDEGERALRHRVVFQFSIAPDSRGVPLVEGEDATEPFASADAADGRGRIARREGDDVAQALMVALGVVVLHELPHDGAQVTLAERDDVPQAALATTARSNSLSRCPRS
jgi:hypothetical protein